MLECTKDMENVKLSPTLNMRSKNRNSINKLRHSSPKLQEVLREVSRLMSFLNFQISNPVNLKLIKVV